MNSIVITSIICEGYHLNDFPDCVIYFAIVSQNYNKKTNKLKVKSRKKHLLSIN